MRLIGTTLLLLLATTLAACVRAPARDPAVVEDVLDYLAKIRKWEPVEARALQAIKDVRRTHFVDDDYVAARLGDVIDDVEIHLAEVRSYEPRTQRVAEVHTRYLHAWDSLHDSFATIIDAMERKDYLLLSRGTEAMSKSRDDLITVAAALNLLLKETGLKQTSSEAAAS